MQIMPWFHADHAVVSCRSYRGFMQDYRGFMQKNTVVSCRKIPWFHADFAPVENAYNLYISIVSGEAEKSPNLSLIFF
jgi:hypothetical protein